jgi:hypothetical protein
VTRPASAPREFAANRTAELLSEVSELADMLAESGDGEGARLLVAGAASACTSWLRDHEAPLESVARALRDLSAVVERLEPGDRLAAWSDVLPYVTARSRADYEAATGGTL